MKKTDKIILIGFTSILLSLIGLFLFGHFQQISPAFGVGHAQDLHGNLVEATSPANTKWIFQIWRVCLSLSNVVVIGMLLFVAIVNIFHLQYDTYAIKKSLPLLIIGIIMANFSLLICRMIVDSAQVISATFASNPKKLAEDLLCSMGFMTSNTVSVMIMTNPSFAVTSLIIMILLLIAILVAVLILAFLLWFRKTVIFLLVAVSPVAFIAYAFPPTQSLFKQWWGWFIKWTFMGPIVMLLIWTASQIGSGNCTTIKGGGSNFSMSALFAVCGVLYLAAIVPFKLGGGVMSAWGNFGKWATGTNKDGYLKKPVDESIQRKKDIAKGAFGTAWGSTSLGRWGDKGKKNEEGLIANYKNMRDTQLTDREKEVREKHKDFAENEKELERAKGRLETTIKVQIGDYIRNNQAAIGQEKLNSINAAGSVEQAEAEAERTARGPVDSHQAIIQRAKEKEVELAKNELELAKGNTEALIREGAFNNLTPAELAEVYGTVPGGAGIRSALDIKNRYLEHDNNLTILKERLAKRAGQDAQVMAERDLRRNSDVRAFASELNDSGISVDADYNLDGSAAAPGSVHVNYAQAREAAEQLRFRATTEEDMTKRANLEAAAQHFDERASNYATANTTYSNTHATAMDAREANLRAQAAAAATPAEQDKLNFQADQMHERAAFVRSHIGQEVGFEKRYLSNNLAGRRQKIVNPDITDEIHTQELSNSPRELIQQVLDGKYGTGEARGDDTDMYNILTGQIDQVSEAGARAGIVQLGAIHSNMKAARHGDAAGLDSIDGFNDLMINAGRPNFKAKAINNSLEAMQPGKREVIQKEAARQHHIANLVAGGTSRADAESDWESLPGADKTAKWGLMSAAEKSDSLENLSFRSLDVKGAGKDSSAMKDFVDRFLTQVEEDPAIKLSNSAGSRLGQQRSVGQHDWTENK